jgi:XPA protein C-terminus
MIWSIYELALHYVSIHFCFSCKQGGRWPTTHAFFNIRLCHCCHSLPQYRTVTATIAKRDYRLTEDDLLPLPVAIRTNPVCATAPRMRLYIQKDVQVACDQKMAKEKTNLREEKRRAAEYGLKVKQRKLRAIESRRRVLVETLTLYGLQDQIDFESRIVKRYLVNSGKWVYVHNEKPPTLERVVDTVLEIHYLTKHTAWTEMLTDSDYIR